MKVVAHVEGLQRDQAQKTNTVLTMSFTPLLTEERREKLCVAEVGSDWWLIERRANDANTELFHGLVVHPSTTKHHITRCNHTRLLVNQSNYLLCYCRGGVRYLSATGSWNKDVITNAVCPTSCESSNKTRGSILWPLNSPTALRWL